MLKHTATATALIALMVAPALAQSTMPPATTTSPPAANDQMKPAAPPSKDMTSPATSDRMEKPMANAPMTKKPPETFVAVRSADEWRASKIIGSSIAGPGGATIGDVNEVLVDTDGGVRYVVIGVGGFLGIGEKNVAVPFSQLTIVPTKDGDAIEKISVTYTKDELKQAPTFKYDTQAAARTNKDKRTELTPRK
jgi:sporulation protein YlmC with PRC-barrel domain